MENFRNGDIKAFENVYMLYNKQLSYFVLKQTNNNEEAEEITSETFLKLWKLRENFETLANVRAFLFIAAKNACVNYYRSAKRVAGEVKDYKYLVPLLDDSTLEREMIEAEFLKMIHDEIENLPEKCKKVIKLAYVDNMKNEDIARQLSIREQTVKNQKSRGLKHLRNKLRAVIRKYLDK